MENDNNKGADRSFHPYAKALESFYEQNVEVKDILGDTVRGKCLGIDKISLNIVLETIDNIIIIKNPMTITKDKVKYEEECRAAIEKSKKKPFKYKFDDNQNTA